MKIVNCLVRARYCTVSFRVAVASMRYEYLLFGSIVCPTGELVRLYYSSVHSPSLLVAVALCSCLFWSYRSYRRFPINQVSIYTIISNRMEQPCFPHWFTFSRERTPRAGVSCHKQVGRLQHGVRVHCRRRGADRVHVISGQQHQRSGADGLLLGGGALEINNRYDRLRALAAHRECAREMDLVYMNCKRTGARRKIRPVDDIIVAAAESDFEQSSTK